MVSEASFRANRVIPFLHSLDKTEAFPIQQVGIAGTPDFLLCCHGTFVALELKAVRGRLSKLQEYKLKRVRETHGVSLVASPNNWEQIKEVLTLLNRGEKV